MGRTLTLATMAVIVVTASGGVGTYAATTIWFVEPPTPVDNATIEGASVPIEVSITDPALVDVTFNWDGTAFKLYDNALVLMFNFDNVSTLGESSTYFVDVSPSISDDGTGQNFEGDEIVAGLYGSAVGLDGLDDYVQVADSADLGISAFTIALWLKADSPTGGTQALVARGEDWTYDKAQWVIELDDAQNPGTVQLWIEESDDADHYYGLSTRPLSADTWYHFAATRTADGTVKVYLNGVKENEWQSQPAPASVPTPVTIGARRNLSGASTIVQDYFSGAVDELRIWNKALSEGEVAQQYMSNLQKYDTDAWALYVNQSNLVTGTYTYQAFASDAGGTSETEQRTVIVDAPAVQPVLLKGPYLQQVTSDSIVIMWETDVAANSRVDYGLAAPDEYFVEDSTLVTIHEVQVGSLTADTLYHYTVTSGSTTSDASTFATAPASPRSFRFVAYGDTRTQPTEHSAVVQGIINSAPEIVVHTGDLVTDGTNYGLWGTEFFDPAYGLMINTPMLPILGNHENNASWFYNFFSLPNNEQWYAFTYGNVRFIGLNTCGNYTSGSSQYNWLMSQLQSTEYNNATWHIVYFHHPPYTATTSHGDDANVQQYLVPLFELYGVDMVFNGHSHAYERYFNNGIYYIVTGGGGAPLAGLVTDNQEPIRQYGESVYHHCTIDVDVPNSSLTMDARYNDGTIFDTVALIKMTKATNPEPVDGATQVAVDTDLSWAAGMDADSHDVYFGTNFDAVSNADHTSPEFKGNQMATTYDLDTLAPDTTYYWSIDEVDSGGGITYGDVWSFTTAPVPGQATNPSPGDGATDVSVDVDLSWMVGSDATSHDVYFGTNPTPGPAEFQGNQTSTTFDPGTLAYKTAYYWRINEIGPGGVSEGSVWSFATGGEMPWSDGFESGDLAAGGWTSSGDASASGAAAYSGSYGGQLKNSAWIEKAISTVGFSNIVVKYARRTGRMDSGEYLYVEWSTDGSTWNQLEQTQDTAWLYQSFTCDAGASDNAGFRVRFSSNANKVNEYAYIDDVEISGTPSGPDVTPPTPDPMTWAVVPHATGSSSISMTATTASDPGGVEYYFACTAGGGHDSGWQDSPTYEDTGLQAGIEYTYQVKARDKSPNQNETGWSSPASATPVDVPPAAPTGLAATPGDSQVSLDWDDNTEADLAGYNVYRSETAGGPYGQVNGALLTTSDYVDTGLTNGTTYYYVVTAVDQGSNESPSSDEASGTPSSQPTVYVESIGMSLVQAGKNWKGVAQVVINPALSGATVAGDWYLNEELIQAGATGVTDGSGQTVVTSVPKKANTGDTYTFRVTDVVVSGYLYDPGQGVTEGSISVP